MESLKKDNAIKVFRASLERSSTSRTALSNDTGLSFVTVDKIVNALIEAHILKQTHSSKCPVIERRSRMLLPKSRYWIAVYEVLPKKISFFMYDLSLRPFESFSYTPEDSIFIDDILNSFLRRTVSFAKNHADIDCCIGSAVLVPGKYDEAEDKVTKSPIYHLPSVRIKEFFSKHSFNTAPRVYSPYFAYSKSLLSEIDQDDAVLSVFLDNQSIFTSYTVYGQKDVNISDIGNLKASCNKSFSRLVRAVPDPDLLFHDLCDVIYILINSLKITKINVCDNLYNNGDAVCSVINSILSCKAQGSEFSIPSIEPANSYDYGRKFISREIRDQWFVEKILTNKA